MTPALASQIRALGVATRAEVGVTDLHSLWRQKASAVLAEIIGRFFLHVAMGPWSWLVGMWTLAYSLSVEAHLNHTIMHGAFVGVPGAGPFVPSRYETLAIPFRSKTWRDAHRIHHANPSVLGEDPDTVHPLFRMHGTQGLRPWHRFNAFIGAFFTFEHWAFDYDAFLKRKGVRARGDRGEWVKLSLYVLYQFVLWPVLAGPNWAPVLAAGVCAVIVRNFIFTGLQTASSVGHAVSTRHATGAPHDRMRFQIETSKNFVLGGLARVLCGGLDRHIEHHLWPHLPPGRLYALSPNVRALCGEDGVRYQEFPSFRASLFDSVSYLHSLRR
jgi:linoleoyl-CoA desaturase